MDMRRRLFRDLFLCLFIMVGVWGLMLNNLLKLK